LTFEEEIKKCGLGLGADIAGIASVKEIKPYPPPGYCPDDILPGAKSVISFAARWTPLGAWQSPNYAVHVLNRTFGEKERLHVSLGVSNFIEKNYGYYTLAFDGALMSQKLPAELAGLGTRSMAGGIILNKELGPINIATVITTMPLKADGPLDDPVCPHASCVKMWDRKGTTPCLEACPECLSGELEDGRIKQMRFNRQLCTTRAQTLSLGGFQRTLLEAIDEPDREKRKAILLGSFFYRTMMQIAKGVYVGQCGECVRVCPIVRKSRTLRPKVVIEDPAD